MSEEKQRSKSRCKIWPSLRTWKSLCKHGVARTIAFTDLTLCSSACINVALSCTCSRKAANIRANALLPSPHFVIRHEDGGQERTGCTSTLPSA
eukprot:scaffold35473_cov72-Phaeocystis_antarctica.AAC.2